jgi:uncharacterized iron-regulated membrane protein
VSAASFSPRGIWRRVHRWTAITLMALLVPLSLSGSLLVWHDALDALLNPGRYATTGAEVALPASAYLANAAVALGQNAEPIAIRFPADRGRPVTVTARSRAGGRLLTVYLDPPTGRVLDTVDARASFLGVVHRLHENLAIPEDSGRSIVGWAGTGMLLLSLTGLWLWWPRGAILSGWRWRRSPATSANLHHLLGFWISLPLAIVSATGTYLSFPQTARTALSSVVPMSPQGPRRGAGELAHDLALTPDRALSMARAAVPEMLPAAILLPSAARSSSQLPSWRIDFRSTQSLQSMTVAVDDRSGTARRLPDPLGGDRMAQWIRWIHEGSHAGPAWRLAVFLCGIFPTALAITGLVIWLRGRMRRGAGEPARQAPQAQAAE